MILSLSNEDFEKCSGVSEKYSKMALACKIQTKSQLTKHKKVTKEIISTDFVSSYFLFRFVGLRKFSWTKSNGQFESPITLSLKTNQNVLAAILLNL